MAIDEKPVRMGVGVGPCPVFVTRNCLQFGGAMMGHAHCFIVNGCHVSVLHVSLLPHVYLLLAFSSQKAIVNSTRQSRHPLCVFGETSKLFTDLRHKK
jgi:hypothetical protein